MPRSGSAISSPPAASRQAMSMSEASLTCELPTSPVTPSAISSPVSVAGASPCASPDGRTTDLFGQAPAPVNPSLPPVRARRPMTSATCGPSGSGLSQMYDRQSSLANRLKRRLDGAGSTLFSLTWRRKATPAGRPYFQLAASGRPTSGSDCGSWPTPVAAISPPAPWKDGQPWWLQSRAARNIEALASWPTPDTGRAESVESVQARVERMKIRHPTKSGMGSLGPLHIAAQLASWPTPMAGTPAQKGYNEAGNNDSSRKTVELCAWPTPCVVEPDTHPDKVWERKQRLTAKTGIYRGNDCGLGSKAQLASWPTPDAYARGGPQEPQKRRAGGHSVTLQDAVHGTASSGSPAPTEKRGQLNPEFSLWLMGYPAEWASCAPQATRSCRSLRRNSSGRPFDPMTMGT
jgi:hypothetical protein